MLDLERICIIAASASFTAPGIDGPYLVAVVPLDPGKGLVWACSCPDWQRRAVWLAENRPGEYPRQCKHIRGLHARARLCLDEGTRDVGSTFDLTPEGSEFFFGGDRH